MSRKNYTINGQIISGKTQKGQKGLKVEAWDKDLILDDFVGSTVTDNEGKFKISFSQKHFKELFIDGKPDLFFRIYKGNRLVKSTEDHVLWNIKTKEKEVTIMIETQETLPPGIEILGKRPRELLESGGEEGLFVSQILNKVFRNILINVLDPEKDKDLVEVISSMNDITIQEYKENSIQEVLDSVVKPLLSQNKEIHSQYEKLKGHFPETAMFQNSLRLNIPVKHSPFFKEFTKRALAKEIVQSTEREIDERFLNRIGSSTAFNNKFWNQMVNEGIFSEDEARDIKDAFLMAGFTGDNLELVKALRSREIKAIDDLVALRKEDWVSIMEEANVPVPDTFKGPETKEAYAVFLTKTIEKGLPTKVFLHRFALRKSNSLPEEIAAFEGFKDLNPDFSFDTDMDYGSAKWPDGFNQQEKEDSLNKISSLTKNVNLYLAEDIFSNNSLSLDEKMAALDNRLDMFNQLVEQNSLDIQYSDLYSAINRNELNWEGISEEEKGVLMDLYLMSQRVLRITNDSDKAIILAENGIYSAHEIIKYTKEEFCKKYMDTFGMTMSEMEAIYGKSQGIVTNTQMQYLTLMDINKFRFWNNSHVNNTGDDIGEYYQSIPSYQELFGTVSYCNCTHCMSIFGPAAYFVDLMRFVDKYITENDDNDIHPTLSLKNRRPDLWDIPLDCKNTNTLIPYLQIVLEILEKKMGATDEEPDLPYAILFETKHPVNLPFNLPLEKIRLFLEHFETSLNEVFDVFEKDGKYIYSEYLKISNEERAILTDSSSSGLTEYYRVDDISELNKVEKFIKQLDITRVELDDLLYQNLDGKEGEDGEDELGEKLHKDFYINNIDPSSDPITIDYTVEEPELINLNQARLTRIHRFIRLAKKLNWSFEDLDWVLRTLNINASKDINDNTITRLGLIQEWKEKFNLPLEILSSFWYKVKDIGKKNDESDEPQDLFNRVFNHPDLLDTGDEIKADGSVTLSLTDTEDKSRNRLLAALELTDEELTLMLDTSRLPATIYTEGTDELSLTEEALTHLYRTSKLFKALGISLEEFYIILDILGISTYTDFKDLKMIIDTVDWLNEYDLGAYDIQYMITGEINDYVDAGYTDEDVRLLTEDCDLSDTFITSSDFLAIEGITEEQASQLYEALTDRGFIEDSDDGGKLLPAYTPDKESFTLSLTDLTNDFGIEDLEDQVITIINQFDSKQVVMEKLGVFFDVSPSILEKIKEFASKSLDDPDFIQLISTPMDEEDEIPDEISEFLRGIHNRKFIADKFELDEDDLAAVLEKPECFSVGNCINLSFKDLKGLSYYWKLKREYSDTEHKIIEYFNTEEASEKISILSEITGYEDTQIEELINHFWPDSADTGYENVYGLMKIRECFEISTYLGVNITTLESWSGLTEADWDTYNNVANTLLETLKAKYGEDEWEEKYGPINDKLLELRRDALASYAIWQIDTSWGEEIAPVEDFNDLYEHLLIDIEMSSCAEISRIKQGIASVQLYVQRCLMNLEPGVLPESIDSGIWEWMKNYRVWEANRKVFLYPENYLEPELRDDKSPLFEGLENELLQQDITDESVQTVYMNYLTQLSELTTLRIAGNYYLDDGEDVTLYLFGRTNSQPPTYYYRKYINNSVWTAWEKIDLTIKAEKISCVYAFGRLFIFWTELKNVPDEDGDKVDKATVYFSYLNMDGRWLQPQALVEDKMLNSASGWGIVYPEFDGDKIIAHYGLIDEEYQEDFDLGNLELYPNFTNEGTELSYTLDGTAYIPITGSCNDLREDELPIDTDNYFQCSSNYIEGLSWKGNREQFEPLAILKNLEYSFPETQAVNSKENWFIFFSGDEEFLMKRISSSNSIIINESEEYTMDPNISTPVMFSYRSADSINIDLSDLSEKDPSGAILDKAEPGVGSSLFDGTYNFIRLSTNTIHEFSKRLFAEGLEGLLCIDSQNISEPDFSRLQPTEKVMSNPYSGESLDFNGAYGPYFQEIFFHIPFIIASTLNANQKFEEAQKWYHYIFNPTISKAEEGINENDRFWQYVPFRGLGIETIEGMLQNEKAIEAYEQDPFNPFAIARLRLYTFQKAIVMKYIDNLLDWGDYLFAQDTWESITEATMLYIMPIISLGKSRKN
jgi:hypothetical protein